MTANVTSMAQVGSKAPWFGIGQEVPEGADMATFVKAAGLDWEVEKRPIAFRKKSAGGSTKTIPDKFALVRKDTEGYLSVAGKSYRPLQNETSFGFFEKFTKKGHMTMQHGGSLMGGQYVWGLAKVGDSFTLPGKDKVSGYVLLLSPHIAGRSMVIQHISIREWCWNQLNSLMKAKNAKASFRMPHVYDFDNVIQAKAEEALGLSQNNLKTFEEQAKALVEKKVSAEWAEDYFKRWAEVGEYAPKNVVASLAAQAAKAAKAGVVITPDTAQRTSPVLLKLRQALITSPGAEAPSAKGTAWGAFNAITYVNDHDSCTDQEKRLRENWLGARAQWKRDALTLALEMAA